jgi:transcriptional regulator with XRE-family HTH domain
MREVLGLTQQALAVAMGKTTVTIARWETSDPPGKSALVELIVFAMKQPQSDQLPVRAFQKALWQPDMAKLRRQAEANAASEFFEEATRELCMNGDRPEVASHWERLSRTLSDGLAALIKSEEKRQVRNITHIAKWQAARERIQEFQKHQPTRKGKPQK